MKTATRTGGTKPRGFLILELHGTSYAPDEFLRILNVGYPDFPLEEKHTYEFVQQVDLIILGPCSRGYGPYQAAAAEFERLFPVGKSVRTVLLMSRCCGPYRKEFELNLREALPAVTWITPSTDDYCNRPSSRGIAHDLETAQILRESWS